MRRHLGKRAAAFIRTCFGLHFPCQCNRCSGHYTAAGDLVCALLIVLMAGSALALLIHHIQWQN